MANVDKKKAKLQAQITRLEDEMKMALQKKSAGKAYDVPGTTRKIRELKDQLAKM